MNNEKLKPTDFQAYLRKQLKDSEFKKYYNKYDKHLKIASLCLSKENKENSSEGNPTCSK